MTTSILGLDIGGANLKAATTDGFARSMPFPLWKHPDRLAEALRELVALAPRSNTLAVTMTGELCDAYETKRQGVLAILDAVETCAAGRALRVWRNDGRFVDLEDARETPLPVAAANWLALAEYAGRFAPEGPGLLLDIGSTTCDIIPMSDGRPCPIGRTDPERLASGELVYTGVSRTPICALGLPRLTAEFFATTHDVHLLLGQLPEDERDCNTADGRPATRHCAHARLARMLGSDAELCPPAETQHLAERAALQQRNAIVSGLAQVASSQRNPSRTVVLSGSGEFLARQAVTQAPGQPTLVSLGERLGLALSQAACAFAVACLLAEKRG